MKSDLSSESAIIWAALITLAGTVIVEIGWIYRAERKANRKDARRKARDEYVDA